MANQVRTLLYQYRKTTPTEREKLELFDQIFELNHSMHWELNSLKSKRKSRAKLLKKRQEAPQTKSMRKKLGLIPKINLETKK